jgi:ABC-type antimicrobial peptide transport system permease subunit
LHYIKYLVSKSLSVLIVTTVTAVLISYFIASFVSAFTMVEQPRDLLSPEHYLFSVGEDREKIDIANLTLNDLLTTLTNDEQDFVLHKTSPMNSITGIYCYKQNFSPNLVAGRSFTNDDFVKRSNTALLSAAFYDELEKEGEASVLFFENNYYEVIGVYEPSDNEINFDSRAYYNLASSNILDGDNNVAGLYALDADRNTRKLVDKADELLNISILDTPVNDGFVENVKRTVSAQSITTISLLLVLAMLILNSINFASNWVDERKRDIFVRKITGATSGRIALGLLRDYVLIISLSFAIGVLIAFLLAQIEIDILINSRFSLLPIVITYILVLVFSLPALGVMLFSYMKNSSVDTRWR